MKYAHSNSATYLYGINPLKEFFLSLERKKEVTTLKEMVVYVTKDSVEKPFLMSLLQKYKAVYEVVTRDEIESMVGKGAVHQGVAMKVPEKYLYATFEEVIAEEKQKERSLIVLLDELEDPHNVGAIIRSAASFGANTVLLPEHSQTGVTGTVIKTASGLNFALSICKIGNINTALEKLKKSGYWVYGLEGSGKDSLLSTEYDAHSVLVVGAEGKGIREKTLELCDFKLSIPIEERAESLNASVAASVALYEWKRQSK